MESELSATEKNTRGHREDKFLGHKRDNRVLKENYLVRRIMSGKVSGKYENLGNTFYNMMAFNWDEERLLKLRSNIMGNINAMAFWFYICSNYFPYCSNQFLEMAGGVPEMLKRVIEKVISNKRVLKKKSHISAKNKFISEVKSFFEDGEMEETSSEELSNNQKNNFNQELLNVEHNMSITNGLRECVSISNQPRNLKNETLTDDIINSLTSKLDQLTQKNSKILAELIKGMTKEDKFLCSFENEFNYDEDEVLIDMKYQNPFTEKFKNYLVKKHEIDAETERTANLWSKESDAIIDPISLSKTHCILTRAEEEKNSNPDDIVCLICNDGDYEDDDLIVYCSSCQMTVHQSCYGIVNLPKEDWICCPCLAFGKEKYKDVVCVLCPVKGGAMKPCNIKKNSQVFSILMKMRNSEQISNGESSQSKFKITIVSAINNDYDLIDKLEQIGENRFDVLKAQNCSFGDQNQSVSEETISLIENDEKETQSKLNFMDSGLINYNFPNKTPNKEEILNNFNTDQSETNKQTVMSITYSSTNKARGRKKRFNKKKNKKHMPSQSENVEQVNGINAFINHKVANDNAWVHLSCALWLPEVSIADFANKEEIKGIESIEKKRFQELCSICKLSCYGPTVKCENEKCSLRFHVECARINKYLLEQVNSYSGELKFYIYCQAHRPHRLIKNHELCRQRSIDDISNFSEILTKNYEILSKIDKRNDFSVFIPRRYGLVDTFNKKSSIFGDLTQFEDFIPERKMIKSKKHIVSNNSKDKNLIIKKVKEIVLVLSNLNIKFAKEEDNEYSLVPFSRSNLKIKYEDTLNPHKFPWYLFKGLTKLSPYEVFDQYRELVCDEAMYNRIILKKAKNLKLKKKKSIIIKPKDLNEGINKENNTTVNNYGDDNNSCQVYCYCKRKEEYGTMIGCFYGESEDSQIKCVNNGWVHKFCVEELKDLDQELIEDPNFIYTCSDCIQMYGDPKVK